MSNLPASPVHFSLPFLKEDLLEHASELMRALAHDLRLDILRFLEREQQASVNEIHQFLGLEQSITSQHLRVLRLANLVHTQRKGKQIFYTLHKDRILRTADAVSDLLRALK